MSFTDRVAECELRLTPADQALVALIEADPVGASLGSAGSLARRAGVHGATAGRLAKKLGFADWRGLADALRNEHIRRPGRPPVEPTGAGILDGVAHLGSAVVGVPSGDRMGLATLQGPLQTPRTPGAVPEGAPSWLSRMTNGMTVVIEAMDNPSVCSTIDAVARRVCNAGVVWIAARADFAAVGQLLQIRLLRCDLNARLLAEDGVNTLAMASPRDVLLEVAGDAPQFRFNGLRRCAAAQGLAVVLIGPLVTSDGDPPPAFHIAVPAGRTGDAVLAGHVLGAVTLASTIMVMRPAAPGPRGPARKLA
jgi:DNA-binding MurR/RpiR family transcriptional regulator